MDKKVLIIGGVAGGASIATRLCRLDEEAEIILVERGSHVYFANCGLPYYIGDVITDRERLLVQTPTNMKELFNLDIRINSEVIPINSSEKTVLIESKKSVAVTKSLTMFWCFIQERNQLNRRFLGLQVRKFLHSII